MRRNPELAHRVTQLPEIVKLRHFAIDKISAASLAIQQLSRATNGELSAVDEIVLEEKVEDLITTAQYHWWKYRKAKMSTYEYLLQEESNKKSRLLNEGSRLIDQHIDDLNYLKDQREGVQ